MNLEEFTHPCGCIVVVQWDDGEFEVPLIEYCHSHQDVHLRNPKVEYKSFYLPNDRTECNGQLAWCAREGWRLIQVVPSRRADGNDGYFERITN